MGTNHQARLDKAKGLATLRDQRNALAGMSVVARDRTTSHMTNSKGVTWRVLRMESRLDRVPQAGDEFNTVKEDKHPEEIAENRKLKLRQEIAGTKFFLTGATVLPDRRRGVELNLILRRTCRDRSALWSSPEKLHNKTSRSKSSTVVSAITESDVMLASTSGRSSSVQRPNVLQ